MMTHIDDLVELNLFPKSWVSTKTGNTYTRLFLEGLDAIELENLGWYPVYDYPVHAGDNQHIEAKPLRWDGEKVVRNWVAVETNTPQELTRMKRITLESATVVTLSGNEFDADEVSQNRMVRAIVSSDEGETTKWILASNAVVTITREELKEALKLAGKQQTELWMS